MAESVSAESQRVPDKLEAEMAALSSKPVSPDFLLFVDALKARFESSLDAVLLYGSCLRSHEVGEGVADFYVVVDGYDKAYPEHYLRHLNAWLPPNVFYLEVSRQEQKFRAKYAVVSMADFERGTRQWFHPYLWAPVKMSVINGDVELHRGTFAFLFASTLDRLLFGMRPYWGREQEPLHVTFVRQQRKHPLRSLLQLLSGQGDVLKEKNGYYSHNTHVLELLIDDVYIVDGESYRAAGGDGSLRISAAGPVCFLVTDGIREKL